MPSDIHVALRARIVQHIEQDNADHAEIRDAVLQHDADTPDEDHTELIEAYVRHVEETEAGHARLLELFDRHVAEVDA